MTSVHADLSDDAPEGRREQSADPDHRSVGIRKKATKSDGVKHRHLDTTSRVDISVIGIFQVYRRPAGRVLDDRPPFRPSEFAEDSCRANRASE